MPINRSSFQTLCQQWQAGISLIELIVFILVVGIAVSSLLSLISTTTAHSADPLVRKQALSIAESLLEEVESMPFTWCDPDDPKYLTAAQAADCDTPEDLGQEGGEGRYAQPYFDNVSDYDGFQMVGIVDLSGNAIPGLQDFTATVSISQAGGAGSFAALPVDAVLQILVEVSGREETIRLSGYRFRHSPNTAG
jgi:MSHA pilin protein MshD